MDGKTAIQTLRATCTLLDCKEQGLKNQVALLLRANNNSDIDFKNCVKSIIMFLKCKDKKREDFTPSEEAWFSNLTITSICDMINLLSVNIDLEFCMEQMDDISTELNSKEYKTVSDLFMNIYKARQESEFIFNMH